MILFLRRSLVNVLCGNSRALSIEDRLILFAEKSFRILVTASLFNTDRQSCIKDSFSLKKSSDEPHVSHVDSVKRISFCPQKGSFTISSF